MCRPSSRVYAALPAQEILSGEHPMDCNVSIRTWRRAAAGEQEHPGGEKGDSNTPALVQDAGQPPRQARLLRPLFFFFGGSAAAQSFAARSRQRLVFGHCSPSLPGFRGDPWRCACSSRAPGGAARGQLGPRPACALHALLLLRFNG